MTRPSGIIPLFAVGMLLSSSVRLRAQDPCLNTSTPQYACYVKAGTALANADATINQTYANCFNDGVLAVRRRARHHPQTRRQRTPRVCKRAVGPPL